MIYLIGKDSLIESPIYQKSTPEECLEYFKDKLEIQVDCETEYNKRVKDYLPNPYEHRVLSFQVGDRDNQFVIDTSIYDYSFLKPLMEDTSKVKILANSFFDLRFLLYKGIRTKNIYDAFLGEMLLTLGKDMPKGYRSLEQMALRYCNIQLNKEIRGQIHYRGLDDTVIKYCAEDVSFMQDIKDRQTILIENDNLQSALKLENNFISVLAEVSYRGLPINVEDWLEVSRANKVKLKFILEELNQTIVNTPELNKFTNAASTGLLFEDMKSCTLNWKSAKQTLPLFQQLGVNTTSKNKQSGEENDSVDLKILYKQINKHPLISVYIRYKELEKEISTYGEDFLKNNLNLVTRRIHSEFFPIVDTGRISSSSPNQQNIPATNEFGEMSDLRKAFKSKEGYKFIIADYSQQEPRITADYSQDPYLIDFILNGDGDSHSLISTMISEYLLGEEVKVTKKNNPVVPKYKQKIRDIGKMINLGLDYGKSAYTVKDDLNCTQDEAQRLLDIIKSKTPEKEKWFKSNFNFVRDNGYILIDSVTNRRAYFYAYDEFQSLSKIPYDDKSKEQISRFYKIRGEMERFSRNYKIQGTGGSMSKLAAILFRNKLEELGYQDICYIIALIHDEICLECREDIAEECAKLLEEAMVNAGTYFCKTIPMKVDAIIGNSWGDKH